MTVGGLSVINMSGGICGAERLCKWMIKEPEVARQVLRLAADHQIAMAQFVKDTFGVDRVLPSGANAFASNQLISPKHFEQFCLPVLKEVHEKVLAMGYKHMSSHPCGEQNLNLPYWQQTSLGDPGMFRVGNEIDLETAASFFPNDIIGGNLDTTVIQNGTPDEVYDAARKVIEQGKSLSTGFVLAPACELPPLAPAENMRAITRALNDFGWYD
jgi:uroporphyrinogen decarboxylase